MIISRALPDCTCYAAVQQTHPAQRRTNTLIPACFWLNSSHNHLGWCAQWFWPAEPLLFCSPGSLLTMPPHKPSMPPLDMPEPDAADAAEPSLDEATVPPALKDYALAAAMGRQLSEPLADMQNIVQALLDTGKISRRKVQMLLGGLARVRQLSMQSQQLARLSQGRVRQSHERLRLDVVVRQALEEHSEAFHQQGVELVQRIRPVEIILDPGMVSALLDAALACATVRGSRLLVTLEMRNRPEHGMLTLNTVQTVVTDHTLTVNSGMVDTVAWRLLSEVARASAVTLAHAEELGHSTLTLEFPRTVRQLEGLTQADMDVSDDSRSHLDSKMVSGQRILLFTSDDSLGQITSRVCNHLGLLLDTATSSELAVRQCEMEKPHLLIFDERDTDEAFDALRNDLQRMEPGFPMISIADDANTLAMSSWTGDSIARIGRSDLRARLPQVLALELAKAL